MIQLQLFCYHCVYAGTVISLILKYLNISYCLDDIFGASSQPQTRAKGTTGGHSAKSVSFVKIRKFCQKSQCMIENRSMIICSMTKVIFQVFHHLIVYLH